MAHDFHFNRSKVIDATLEFNDDQSLNLPGVKAYSQDDLEQGVLVQVEEAVEAEELALRKRNIQNHIDKLQAEIIKLSDESSTPAIAEKIKILRKEASQHTEKLLSLETPSTSTEGNEKPSEILSRAIFSLNNSDSNGIGSDLITTGEITPFEQKRLLEFQQQERKDSKDLLKTTSLKEVDLFGPTSNFIHGKITKKIPKKKSNLPSCSKVETPQPSEPGSNHVNAKKSTNIIASKTDRRPRKPKKRSKPVDKCVADGSESEYHYSGTEDEDEDDDDAESEPKIVIKAGRKQQKTKAGCSTLSKIYPDDGSDTRYARRLKDHQRSLLLAQQAKIDAGLDVDLEEEETEIELDGGYRIPENIWDQLYMYQKTGVRWLWELHQQSVGGIMGDEMGLGKTIQIIAFLAGLRRSKVKDTRYGWKGLGPTLIVAPVTVMQQWVREFHKWFPLFRVCILHSTGSYSGSKAQLISKVCRHNGVLITSYNSLTLDKEVLESRKWHYIILDEGHKIRNPDAQMTLAVKQFKTPYRLILSGSPMQNSLRELWSLFDFVYPGRLGTLPVFLQEFGIPITQGGYANATKVEVETAYRCALVLRDSIAPYLLRRMKKDVQASIQLPTKHEQVLFCGITEDQRRLYKGFLASRECAAILNGNMHAFAGLITLRKICNHPDLFDGGPNKMGEVDETEDPTATYGYYKRSGKMIVVEGLLKLWKEQGHRVLLFSQSKQMLNILEKFLVSRSYYYLRMDGSTAVSSRQKLVAQFNSSPEIFVFLLTTKVGGLGLNLTAANRVVIFDPDWNPSTDAQARERASRIGQTRSVTIYRLITAGTLEEKIYQRQIFKQLLTNRILSDPRQRRFFKTNDLAELFVLQDDELCQGSTGTETSNLFAGAGPGASIVAAGSRKRKGSSHYNSGVKKLKGTKSALGRKLLDELVPSVFPEDNVQNGGSVTPMLSDGEIVDDDDEQPQFIPMKPHSEKVANKVEHLKQLARKLAQTMKQKDLDATAEKLHTDANQPEETSIGRKHHKHHHHHHHHRKHKKKHKSRRGELEGVKIENLRRHENTKSKMENKNDTTTSKEEEDYVLSSLFKNAKVSSVLQHDSIMEYSAKPDYDLVEGEAQRVAARAAKALSVSQRKCRTEQEKYLGVPTWTGCHGRSGAPDNWSRPKVRNTIGNKANPFDGQMLSKKTIDIAKRRSLKSKSKTVTTKPKHLQVKQPKAPNLKPDVTKTDKPEVHFSAQQLISAIRERKLKSGLSSAFDIEDPYDSDYEGVEPKIIRPRVWIGSKLKSEPQRNDHATADQSSAPAAATDLTELAFDIRAFFNSNTSTSNDCSATTNAIMSHFKPQLGRDEDLPAFRSLLKQLCTYSLSNESGLSLWRLKCDYR